MKKELPSKLPIQFRELTFKREAVDEEKRTVTLSFSSNTPVSRWYGTEILSHSRDAINTERLDNQAVPHLFNHDWDRYAGDVIDYKIQGGRTFETVQFSENALGTEIFNDIKSGIRKNVSVGYSVDEIEYARDLKARMSMKQIREMLGIPDEDADPDLDDDDDEERIVVTRWTPFETSSVTVPADFSVGVGRDAGSLQKRTGIYAQEFEYRINRPTEKTPSEPMSNAAPTNPNPNPADTNGGNGARNAEPPVVDVKVIQEKAREDARTQEVTRVREIYAIGSRFGKQKEAEEFVTSGRSVQEFQSELLKDPHFNSQPVSSPVGIDSPVGMNEREVKRFSLVKAIREASGITMQGVQLDPSKRGLTGLEKEACDAMAKRIGKSPNGFFLPGEILQTSLATSRDLDRMGRRDLTATNVTSGSAGNAGLTVADILLTPMIELLRNAMIMNRLGATVLSGLTSNVYFPRQTAGGQAYWLPETGGVTPSAITFDQVPLTPHRIAAQMVFSKQLLIQSSIDVEALVRFEIAYRIAAELDRTALQGDGTQTVGGTATGSPYGIYPRSLASGSGYPAGIINTVSRATLPSPLTYPIFATMVAQLMAANVPLMSIGWVGNPTLWEETMTTPRFLNSTSLGSIAIQSDQGTILGYPFFPTNQLALEADGATASPAANSLFLGAWNQILIGVWDGFDLVVDPYTKAGTGEIAVTAQQFGDVNVRHPQAFVVAT